MELCILFVNEKEIRIKQVDFFFQIENEDFDLVYLDGFIS